MHECLYEQKRGSGFIKRLNLPEGRGGDARSGRKSVLLFWRRRPGCSWLPRLMQAPLEEGHMLWILYKKLCTEERSTPRPHQKLEPGDPCPPGTEYCHGGFCRLWPWSCSLCPLLLGWSCSLCLLSLSNVPVLLSLVHSHRPGLSSFLVPPKPRACLIFKNTVFPVSTTE